MIVVSVYLPSDALSQHLWSYLGFSYLGRGVSLHSCSSKAQLLFLVLDEGYLLTAAPPDLERGVAPLCPPMPAQPRPLGRGVAPPGGRPWPPALGSSCTVTAWHSLPPPQTTSTESQDEQAQGWNPNLLILTHYSNKYLPGILFCAQH